MLVWRTLARARVLGLDAHADLHRRAPRRVDRRVERQTTSPMCDRLEERHAVHARGHDAPRRECRTAASPAASSQKRMTVPPWTKPALLASSDPSSGRASESDSEGVRAVHEADGTVRAMPGLSGRFTTVVKAKISKMLDQGRGSAGDPRLLVREAARAAAERQEGHRRRRDVEEAPADAVRQARAAGRQARHAGAPGARAPARRTSPAPRSSASSSRRPSCSRSTSRSPSSRTSSRS